MISIYFSLSNPFAKESFSTIWSSVRQLTTHKVLEVETYRYSRTLIEINFDLTFRTDHAGIKVGGGLLGYIVNVTIYDHRHWNKENNAWENNLKQ